MARLRRISGPVWMRTREGRSSLTRGWLGAWHKAQVAASLPTRWLMSSWLVENMIWPARLNIRMRSIPCLSAMVCITW